MDKQMKPAIRMAGFTDDWERRKVGDYYCFKNGLNKGKEFFGYGIPIVNFTDVFHNRGICALNLKGKVDLQPSEIANYKVQKGDIFFTRTSETIDEIGYSSVMLDEPIDTVFSGFVLRGRAIDEDPLTISFKRYIFYTELFRKEMVMKSSMTTRALTSGTAIKQMEFQFPPNKDEQDKIGDYFQNLDNLITLHQRKCDKLQKVKKSMQEKMFPKNGADLPEIRFKGYTGAWENRKLSDIATEIKRNDPESLAPIMMITANHGFIEQSERYAFNNAGESLKKYILLKKGELAYNHGASKLRPYGSCFSLTNVEEARIPFVYHCFSVDGNNPSFMAIELNSTNIENQLRRIVSSGARMDGLLNISFNEYTSVTVRLPKVDEQNRIADFFRNLDNLITLHQRELEKLQNLKKTLLEKMFV